jgi:hypothetical protein
LNCTSTLKWLGRNNDSDILDYQLAFNKCFDSNYTGLSDRQIDEKLKLCNLTNAVSFPDYYETRILSLFLIELIPFVCIPCACLIGLFFNLKIIQTIQKNEVKILKEDFYKYMKANAKFNCLYCLIFVLYPINSCNWNPSYHFCSAIYTAQLAQYFKIIIATYLGETIKMSANISYLMMTLNRYLLIGKDQAPWLVKIAKLEFKWVIRGSLLFSALINIGHGWEYQAMADVLFTPVKYNGADYAQLLYDTTDPMVDYSPLFRSYADYPVPNTAQPFFIYSIIYFCLNFLALFVLNTFIEAMIVTRMRREMREKRVRMAALGNQTSEDVKAEEDEKKERRVIKMVVLNGLLNFFLRSPDLLVWLQYSAIRRSISTGSSWEKIAIDAPGFLALLMDVSYFSFILTFTTNFIIFYLFNSKFKETVHFWTLKK